VLGKIFGPKGNEVNEQFILFHTWVTHL